MTGDDDLLRNWIDAAAEWLGFDAEPLKVPYIEVDDFLRTAGPSLLRLPAADETDADDNAGPRFLLVVEGRPRRLTLLAPDLSRVHVDPAVVRAALCRELEAPLANQIDGILTAVVSGSRRERGRRALLKQLLNDASVESCWLLRARHGAGCGHRPTTRDCHCCWPVCWVCTPSRMLCISCRGGCWGWERSADGWIGVGYWPGRCCCSHWSPSASSPWPWADGWRSARARFCDDG